MSIENLLGEIFRLDEQYPIQNLNFSKDEDKLTITVSPQTFAIIDTDYLVDAKITANKIRYVGSCDIEIIKSEHKDFNMVDYANQLLGGMKRVV